MVSKYALQLYSIGYCGLLYCHTKPCPPRANNHTHVVYYQHGLVYRYLKRHAITKSEY